MPPIDSALLHTHVLRQQHLAPAAKVDDVVQIVEDISGLYATNPATPYLSLAARSRCFTREDLDRELYNRRTLGRIRCMRKTIYILPPELLLAAHWATRCLTVEASRRYLEFRGVSYKNYDKISLQMVELLKGRELTAAEIKQALNTRWDVAAILSLMCDRGLLIRGRLERGGSDPNYRYALFTDYFPGLSLEPMSEREATMRLVRCYLKSFGPATEDDVAWWTGLNRVSVHIALQHMHGEVIHIQLADYAGDYLMLHSDAEALQRAQPAPCPIVNLLPGHDPYLLGYKQRDRYLEARYADRVFDQTGHVTSTILLDGRVRGVWDFETEKRAIKLFLFEAATDEVLAAIQVEAQRLARSWTDEAVSVQLCERMTRLTQQPAGSVASPLKDLRSVPIQ